MTCSDCKHFKPSEIYSTGFCSWTPDWPLAYQYVGDSQLMNGRIFPHIEADKCPQFANGNPVGKPKFHLGDMVRKIKGSQWHGQVVGTYSTQLTPEGYAVESATEKGSVQIYPAAALEYWDTTRQ